MGQENILPRMNTLQEDLNLALEPSKGNGVQHVHRTAKMCFSVVILSRDTASVCKH